MRLLSLVLVLLTSTQALAQADVFFRSGAPPVFKEEEPDRRFAQSRVARALAAGTQDPNCAQVLNGFLTLLGETAPYLHKRDENFYLDPVLVKALSAQLINPRFPGNAYLASMVRRVMIDGKLDPRWLALARALNGKGARIDISKLELLADGVKPIESFYFTFPALMQRYELEVKRANTSAKDTALMSFRDAYLDREVAWSGLTVIDIGPPPKPKKRKGHHAAAPEYDPSILIARLEWYPPDPRADDLDIFGKKHKPKPVIFEAQLAPNQYVDLQRIPKGTRVLVRGRFWEMSDDLHRVELRNALIFGERDWTQGAFLADPRAVAQCPFATNDLAGTAPVQPGGFGQRLR